MFPERPDARRRARLRRLLLAWYAENKRDLPWRATSDPYAIWISEAMLQQTRVETVRDYWVHFLERFPTVVDLAEADEEDVLAMWSGLGYYRRARQLHAAARFVVMERAGEFPHDRKGLLELPGVGPYTAGAVASIAFDQPEPLVDGNVVRVFSRLFALDAEPTSKDLERELWARAAELVPEKGAGDWNQALMELGATICTPTRPLCLHCPVRKDCDGLTEGLVEVLPRAKKKVAPIDVTLSVLVVRKGSRVVLEQRAADADRMPGMWQFPTLEAGTGTGLYPDRFTKDAFEQDEVLGELRHGITHHRIRAAVVAGRLVAGTRLARPFRWVEIDQLGALALTGMAKKVLARFAARFAREESTT